MKKNRPSRPTTQLLQQSHKYLGLFSALFILLLSLTGIALNHTDALKLSQRYLSSNWLLEHYSIRAPSSFSNHPINALDIFQVDELIVINNKIVAHSSQAVSGAVEKDGFIIIALKDQLLLLDDSFQLVETLTKKDAIPNRIESIGLSKNNRLILKSQQQLFSINDSFSQVSLTKANAIQWSTTHSISPSTQQQLSQLYRSHIIRLETLILDLHSGRFFGQYGVLIFDLIALLMIILAISGIWLWLRQKPHRR